MGETFTVVTHSISGAHSRIDFADESSARRYAAHRELCGDVDRLEIIHDHHIIYVRGGEARQTTTA